MYTNNKTISGLGNRLLGLLGKKSIEQDSGSLKLKNGENYMDALGTLYSEEFKEKYSEFMTNASPHVAYSSHDNDAIQANYDRCLKKTDAVINYALTNNMNPLDLYNLISKNAGSSSLVINNFEPSSYADAQKYENLIYHDKIISRVVPPAEVYSLVMRFKDLQQNLDYEKVLSSMLEDLEIKITNQETFEAFKQIIKHLVDEYNQEKYKEYKASVFLEKLIYIQKIINSELINKSIKVQEIETNENEIQGGQR